VIIFDDYDRYMIYDDDTVNNFSYGTIYKKNRNEEINYMTYNDYSKFGRIYLYENIDLSNQNVYPDKIPEQSQIDLFNEYKKKTNYHNKDNLPRPDALLDNFKRIKINQSPTSSTNQLPTSSNHNNPRINLQTLPEQHSPQLALTKYNEFKNIIADFNTKFNNNNNISFDDIKAKILSLSIYSQNELEYIFGNINKIFNDNNDSNTDIKAKNIMIHIIFRFIELNLLLELIPTSKVIIPQTNNDDIVGKQLKNINKVDKINLIHSLGTGIAQNDWQSCKSKYDYMLLLFNRLIELLIQKYNDSNNILIIINNKGKKSLNNQDFINVITKNNRIYTGYVGQNFIKYNDVPVFNLFGANSSNWNHSVTYQPLFKNNSFGAGQASKFNKQELGVFGIITMLDSINPYVISKQTEYVFNNFNHKTNTQPNIETIDEPNIETIDEPNYDILDSVIHKINSEVDYKFNKIIENLENDNNDDDNNVDNNVQENKKHKTNWLNNIKTIYNEENLWFDADMQDFLLNIFINEYYNKINVSMKLIIYDVMSYDNKNFVMDDIIDDDKSVQENLLIRYPVYMNGTPQTHLYDIKNVQKVLGYGDDYIKEVISRKRSIRYGIVGKAFLFNEQNATTTINNYFWIYHVWGINLEGTTVEDYKYFIDANNKFKLGMLDKFLEIYEKIFISIFETAIIIYNEIIQPQKIFTIRMPLIGVGAFLSAYHNDDKFNLQKQIIDQLIKVRDIYKQKYNYIILDVCITNDNINLKYYYDKKSPDNLSKYNLFDHIDEINLNYTMVVNAWDNKSFIGNGLRGDESIDGWLVGGYGVNNELKNSSYLHNAFFSNNILENKNWYIIEKNDDNNTITTSYINKKAEKGKPNYDNAVMHSIANAVTHETPKNNACSIS
jgi:hypothetical protein